MTNSAKRINVLLVGGGGREHALAWRMRRSPRLGALYITHAENPGLAAEAAATASDSGARGGPIDCPCDPKAPFRLTLFCEKHDVGLVVIGPEEPLALGLADALAAPGRVVFGPTAAGARLEANKSWAKEVLRSASVPMPEGRSFTDPIAAKAFLSSREYSHVVKASGLAKGKGVVVPSSLQQALDAIDRIMINREFGDAGQEVVIEEAVSGREVSVMALVDGRTIYVLEPCQDHKRLGDGDSGPNTGGMGAYCPGGLIPGSKQDDATLDIIQRDILVPTVDALKREGIDFRGVLFAGLMLTPGGPKVLEFNVRFGDPECQALMARFDADLVETLHATALGRLGEVDIRWAPSASCCVVLASKGYPNAPTSGDIISGIDEAIASGEGSVHVFHAGTRRAKDGSLVTGGGRVLNVVATGDNTLQARDRAYRAASRITFPGMIMRTDIATSAC